MKGKKKTYTVWGNYRFIYGELWRENKSCIFFSIAEILFGVAVAFGAILMPSLMIGTLEQRAGMAELARNILLIFLLYGILCGISIYLKQRNAFQFVVFRTNKMAWKIYEKDMDLDYSRYEKEDTQRLRQKASEAFRGNYVGLEGILHDDVNLVTAFLGLLLYVACISRINAGIVLLLFGISVLQVAAYRLAVRYETKNKEKEAKLSVSQNYLSEQSYEVAAGKDVRLYQLQYWLDEAYRKVNRKYQTLKAKENSVFFANDLFGLILQLGRDIFCYGWLIGMLKEGMAVSKFVLYIGMVGGFSGYFTTITNEIARIGRFQKSISYLREYLELEGDTRYGTGERLTEGEDVEIVFSHVDFSYPGQEKKVLEDVSFTIKKGEKMALVGINGAGKSTIVKLLCGFYQPDAGHIYVNGVDIRELDLADYYGRMAVMFQNNFIHSYTVAENICCAPAGVYDRKRCVDALKKAGLWEYIEKLPNQEETYLGKDIEPEGVGLSGGQIQKLMLARALYRNCSLLLLDEPTAALDAIAEHEMYESYDRLLAGKTMLFISHRLASTRFCDKIILLEEGKIVEEGTHEELLEKGGSYADMFEVQSRYYREEEGKENEAKESMA